MEVPCFLSIPRRQYITRRIRFKSILERSRHGVACHDEGVIWRDGGVRHTCPLHRGSQRPLRRRDTPTLEGLSRQHQYTDVGAAVYSPASSASRRTANAVFPNSDNLRCSASTRIRVRTIASITVSGSVASPASSCPLCTHAG